MGTITAKDGTEIYYKGEDDQIVPFSVGAARPIKLLKHGRLKAYPGFPHGMPTTNADVINADLLAFIKGEMAATV